jgi:maleate cis-trans isomerase
MFVTVGISTAIFPPKFSALATSCFDFPIVEVISGFSLEIGKFVSSSSSKPF